VCREGRLIIELDGSLHNDQAKYNEARDRFLERAGFRIIRFDNGEVEYLSTVLEKILAALNAFSPQPSPPLRGGEGESRKFG